jgi:hypothetical protein
MSREMRWNILLWPLFCTAITQVLQKYEWQSARQSYGVAVNIGRCGWPAKGRGAAVKC